MARNSSGQGLCPWSQQTAKNGWTLLVTHHHQPQGLGSGLPLGPAPFSRLAQSPGGAITWAGGMATVAKPPQ